MPALLIALGSAFSWIVSALLAGLAGATFQKVAKIALAAVMLPIVIGWLGEKLVGFNPFDLSQLLSGFLGGFPSAALHLLDAFGIIVFIVVNLKADVAVYVVRLLFRVMGLGK